MDAFATYQDLEKRLGQVFPEAQRPQITALLEDASTVIRSVVGQDIFPQRRVTFTAWPDAEGRVRLPQSPVVEVHTEGAVWDGEAVTVRTSPAEIDFTYGYASAPELLVQMTCVLVAQTLRTLELNLGLNAGGLSSIAIDDFRAAFADGGEHTGMVLTPRNEALLRDAFGVAGVTVVRQR